MTPSLERWLSIPPDMYASLANVYQFTGRSGAAVEELRHVLADQPSNDEAHRRLGEILMSEGRPAEALEHFQAAVGLRPQYWLNHNRLGGFFVRQGRLQEAIAAYTRVTELRPYNSEGYLELGTAFQASGDKVHARENLEKSIAIKPESAAYSNLGALHYSRIASKRRQLPSRPRSRSDRAGRSTIAIWAIPT